LLDCSYCYALVHQVLTHLVVGGSVAIPPQPAWLGSTGRYIEQCEATTLAVVPSNRHSLLELPRLRGAHARVRMISIGGALVAEGLLHRAQQALPSVRLVVTY